MKLRFQILNLLAVFGLAVTMAKLRSEDATPVKNPIAELIDKLPRQELLDKAYHGAPNEGKVSDEHSALLRSAAEIVKQLRTLLKPGTSMFNYPGLMAKGHITYEGTASKEDGGYEKYSMYIGFPPGSEGVGKTDFIIIFDDKGMIHEIRSIDYKL